MPPERELRWARHGTAYFARKLTELTDREMDADGLVPGQSRRAIVADVGYHARALARLLDWAETGVERRMYRAPGYREAQIAYGATLNPLALRTLYAHAAIHLDVTWRDLPAPAWRAMVRDDADRPIAASETVWMRAVMVWLRAVDLGNGGSLADGPPDFLDELVRRGVVPAGRLPRLRAVSAS